MSYDLEVLVIGQKEQIKSDTDSIVKTISEFEKKPLRFNDMWSFMTNQEGIWYSLGLEEDDLLWTQNLLETDFNKGINQKCYTWIEDTEYLENITPLRVKKKYLIDYEKTLKCLLSYSPINMIMVLARYQGGDEEIIQGPIRFEKYIDMLQNDEIPFNVCSIIRK
jgi:hypothetical protein